MIFLLTTQDYGSEDPVFTNRSNYAAGDAFTQVIVRAVNEKRARQLAAQHAGDEKAQAWLHPSTTVKKLVARSYPLVFRGNIVFAPTRHSKETKG